MGSAHLSIWCSPRQSVRFIVCMKEDHKMKWSLCLEIDLNGVIDIKAYIRADFISCICLICLCSCKDNNSIH